MQQYLFRRLLQGVFTLLVVAVLTFILSRVTGDPIAFLLPEDASEQQRAEIRRGLGLDRPYHIQLALFLSGALRGDLGESIRYRQPATALFFERLPNTLRLVPVALVFALILAVPLGIFSAVRRGTLIDQISTGVAVVGLAAPSFWLGIVLIYVFAVTLRVLPVAGMGGPEYYVLPALTLGTFLVAGLMRLLRSSLLEILGTDFIRTARSKGLSESAIVIVHALRNALIPVLTYAGVLLSVFVTGAIVVETVFAWPGVGRLAYEAVIFRDYPLLQAIILWKAAFILLITLAVDVLCAYLDPRIRYA
jgi:peptide/nickel transport system permease protein